MQSLRKFGLPSKRTLLLLAACLFFCYAFYRAYRFAKRVLKLPTTDAVLGALFVAGSNWEMYVLGNDKAGDSISAVVRKWAQNQTFIPFAMGLLSRHLFGDDERLKAAFLAGWEAGFWWPCLDKAAPSDPGTASSTPTA